MWKIHNSSLLTATAPQCILTTISVSPRPKFLKRQLVLCLEDTAWVTATKPTPGGCSRAKLLTLMQEALPLDASGRTSTLQPCLAVPVWWKRTLQSLLTLERMVQLRLRLLNLPHWQPKRRERLAAGKLVEEPDAD